MKNKRIYPDKENKNNKQKAKHMETKYIQRTQTATKIQHTHSKKINRYFVYI